ncbi:hypothetical protein GQ42DRAFT_156272 [Ramicandelaber brevisporus]|nr:hypothetical protein GQ42DRAFT_156272 [Ramicandelaber brevisporus]
MTAFDLARRGRPAVLQLYRALLRESRRLPDGVQRDFSQRWIRGCFRTKQTLRSQHGIQSSVDDGQHALRLLQRYLRRHLDDYRRVRARLMPDSNSSKYTRAAGEPRLWRLARLAELQSTLLVSIRDIRPRNWRKRLPHPAYHIPLDMRTCPDVAEKIRSVERDYMALYPRLVPLDPQKLLKYHIWVNRNGRRSRRRTQRVHHIRRRERVRGIHAIRVSMEQRRRRHRQINERNVKPRRAYLVQSNFGIQFYRIRGMKQPPWLGPLVARLVICNQRRRDQLAKVQQYRYEMETEAVFEEMVRMESGCTARHDDEDGAHQYLPYLDNAISRLKESIQRTKSIQFRPKAAMEVCNSHFLALSPSSQFFSNKKQVNPSLTPAVAAVRGGGVGVGVGVGGGGVSRQKRRSFMDIFSPFALAVVSGGGGGAHLLATHNHSSDLVSIMNTPEPYPQHQQQQQQQHTSATGVIDSTKHHQPQHQHQQQRGGNVAEEQPRKRHSMFNFSALRNKLSLGKFFGLGSTAQSQSNQLDPTTTAAAAAAGAPGAAAITGQRHARSLWRSATVGDGRVPQSQSQSQSQQQQQQQHQQQQPTGAAIHAPVQGHSRRQSANVLGAYNATSTGMVVSPLAAADNQIDQSNAKMMVNQEGNKARMDEKLTTGPAANNNNNYTSSIPTMKESKSERVEKYILNQRMHLFSNDIEMDDESYMVSTIGYTAPIYPLNNNSNSPDSQPVNTDNTSKSDENNADDDANDQVTNSENACVDDAIYPSRTDVAVTAAAAAVVVAGTGLSPLIEHSDSSVHSRDVIDNEVVALDAQRKHNDNEEVEDEDSASSVQWRPANVAMPQEQQQQQQQPQQQSPAPTRLRNKKKSQQMNESNDAFWDDNPLNYGNRTRRNTEDERQKTNEGRQMRVPTGDEDSLLSGEQSTAGTSNNTATTHQLPGGYAPVTSSGHVLLQPPAQGLLPTAPMTQARLNELVEKRIPQYKEGFPKYKESIDEAIALSRAYSLAVRKMHLYEKEAATVYSKLDAQRVVAKQQQQQQQNSNGESEAISSDKGENGNASEFANLLMKQSTSSLGAAEVFMDRQNVILTEPIKQMREVATDMERVFGELDTLQRNYDELANQAKKNDSKDHDSNSNNSTAATGKERDSIDSTSPHSANNSSNNNNNNNNSNSNEYRASTNPHSLLTAGTLTTESNIMHLRMRTAAIARDRVQNHVLQYFPIVLNSRTGHLAPSIEVMAKAHQHHFSQSEHNLRNLLNTTKHDQSNEASSPHTLSSQLNPIMSKIRELNICQA